MGQGVLYESLNIASLWNLPIVFVVENNRYAQTTPVELAVSGTIPGRFAAFDIPIWERDTTDVLDIRTAAAEVVEYARNQTKPAGLIPCAWNTPST